MRERPVTGLRVRADHFPVQSRPRLKPGPTKVFVDEPPLMADVAHLRRSSRGVMGEDVVAIFRRGVAGEAGLVQGLVARLSVLKVSEAPTARGGVLLGVLDHELNIHGGADKEGLSAGEFTGQGFVVVWRGDTSPMNGGNDGAVRERARPFSKGLDGYVVAELSAQLVGLTRYQELVHGD